MISGTKVYKHSTSRKARQGVCDKLNQGLLDGVIFTPKTGGVGLTLIGASVMIFMGSMYAMDYEEQAIGSLD